MDGREVVERSGGGRGLLLEKVVERKWRVEEDGEEEVEVEEEVVEVEVVKRWR